MGERAMPRTPAPDERSVYATYRPLVLGFVARRLHNLEESEAVTHEVFLRAFAHLRAGGAPEALAGWLLAVARNLVNDRFRREAVAARLIVADPVEVPEAAAHDLQAVQRAMSALPLAWREVLTLRYADDLSFAEIAERLGISKNAAFARHERALEALRAQFAPEVP
jgi:RNA polymerase sigma-70 factor (ECF subfamily)